MVQFTSGQKTDSRTLAMLKEAEKQSGCPIVVVQGSWSNGKYSAGTHSGAGVVDIRVWNQSSPAAIDSLELWLRKVGFAAWYRTIGSGPHIHAVAIGADGLHWSAANQVKSYYNGRDGLAANGKDPGPRLNPIPTWESYNKDQTLPDTGGDDDLPYSEKDLEKIVERSVNKVVESQFRRQKELHEQTRKLVDGHVLRLKELHAQTRNLQVRNPVTGKTWPLDDVLWSIWFYSLPEELRPRKAGASADFAVKEAPARTDEEEK